MPDFEALIRHQQLKQPRTNQRLKVVDTPDFEAEKNIPPKISKSVIAGSFIVGFAGSLIGTLTILFLYTNDFLSMDLLKI